MKTPPLSDYGHKHQCIRPKFQTLCYLFCHSICVIFGRLVKWRLRRYLTIVLKLLSISLLLNIYLRRHEYFKTIQYIFREPVSASQMLTQSQMMLSKQIVLKPTTFSCERTLNTGAPKRYPILIVVKTRAISSGEHYERRLFIRDSWGVDARKLGIPVVYAIGHPNDTKTQKSLENEHKTFGDILQFGFKDTYYNVTIKTTGILNWFYEYGCVNMTSYLLIIDDDVLINLEKILEMIGNNTFSNGALYGFLSIGGETPRTGRWAMSWKDYPAGKIPHYIIGGATIYPTDVAGKLLKAIFEMIETNQPILFVDDILINGVLPARRHVPRIHIGPGSLCPKINLISTSFILQCSKSKRIEKWKAYLSSRMMRGRNQTTSHSRKPLISSHKPRNIAIQ